MFHLTYVRTYLVGIKFKNTHFGGQKRALSSCYAPPRKTKEVSDEKDTLTQLIFVFTW